VDWWDVVGKSIVLELSASFCCPYLDLPEEFPQI
jgi:hypothetical protein